MVTEILVAPFVDGQSSEDINQLPALKQTLETVLSQEGCQNAFWGPEHENADNLHMFFNWSSLDDHTAFTKKDTYGDLVNTFGKAVDLSKMQMYHADLSPDPSKVLDKTKSPATEILVMYFPLDYTQADKDKFDGDVRKLYKAVEGASKDYTASAGGWIIEELPIPDSDEKGLAYAGFIGWSSVQAHLDFRSTQEFKDNIHLLRGAKDLKKLHVVHYHGQEGKR